jgi:hypothetical protein
MDVTISLTDGDFDSAQRKLVREALGLPNDTELAKAMKRLGKAAALEYVNMFVEKGMPTRADEVRQDRLYFLITPYYQNRLPPESEVSSIFQLTSSQSRTLLRNTRSRYRTKLGAQVNASAKHVISSAKKNKDTGQWEMLIDADVILEELNLVIAKKGPTLKPVHLKKESSGQYEAEQDTYDLLKKEYGVV